MSGSSNNQDKYKKFISSFDNNTNKMNDWPEWKRNVSLQDNSSSDQTATENNTDTYQTENDEK